MRCRSSYSVRSSLCDRGECPSSAFSFHKTFGRTGLAPAAVPEPRPSRVGSSNAQDVLRIPSPPTVSREKAPETGAFSSGDRLGTRNLRLSFGSGYRRSHERVVLQNPDRALTLNRSRSNRPERVLSGEARTGHALWRWRGNSPASPSILDLSRPSTRARRSLNGCQGCKGAERAPRGSRTQR